MAKIISIFWLLFSCNANAQTEIEYINEDSLIRTYLISEPLIDRYFHKISKLPYNGWVVRHDTKYFSIFRVANGFMDGECLGYKKLGKQYQLIYYLHYSRGNIMSDCRYHYSTGNFRSVQIYSNLGLFDDQNLDSRYIEYSEKHQKFVITEVYLLKRKYRKYEKLKFVKHFSPSSMDSAIYRAYQTLPNYFPYIIYNSNELPKAPNKYIQFGNDLFVTSTVPPIRIVAKD
jgi:hypothetical protein